MKNDYTDDQKAGSMIFAEFADTTAATIATIAVVEISGRISTTVSVNFLKND